jgi:hypothetical protein
MDEGLAYAAAKHKNETIPGVDVNMGTVFESLLKPAKDITGEHVGRAAGRFIGDEIGVLTGMGLGGVAAGALGIKSDKDKKIEQLQQQLGNRYY